MITLPGYLQFKTPNAQTQFVDSPLRLREVVLWAVDFAHTKLHKPALTITRVRDPVEHGSESGVHPAGRAVDLRDQTSDDQGNTIHIFTSIEADTFVNTINSNFPRADGKLTCIHHSVNQDPMHFHFQIPYSWLSPDERKRFV